MVLHDTESSIDVDHCFDPGCYSHQIKYNASLRQMTMLSALSNECHQTIQVQSKRLDVLVPFAKLNICS